MKYICKYDFLWFKVRYFGFSEINKKSYKFQLITIYGCGPHVIFKNSYELLKFPVTNDWNFWNPFKRLWKPMIYNADFVTYKMTLDSSDTY